MPFCPKCGKEIDYLHYWENALNTAKFDGEHYHDWDTVETYEYGYECPECGFPLFSNEDDAIKFLKDDVEAHIKAMGMTMED